MLGTAELVSRNHNYDKNPTWTIRNRNILIRKWREGIRLLYLSDQSQWPKSLRIQGKSPYGASDKPKHTASDELATKAPLSKDETVLPPMDESVVNELSQPNMPTFQEFHAKVLGENQNRRRLDLTDDTSGLTPGQTIKGGGASGTTSGLSAGVQSNLSKQPNRGDEGLTNLSPTPDNTSMPSTPADYPGSDASEGASDIIFPSSVSENGGGNGSGGGTGSSGTSNNKRTELRVMRNIAASECGAKLLQASPAAKHAHAILVDNNDEYMNQPCASEKWFIIETCEPVHLGTIQIANYELFSSRYKTFRVFVSDRYPAKQWELIGTFQAQDVKGLQTFRLGGSPVGRLIKYVKFDILDHYGNEHFCPVTMVRLFAVTSDEIDETPPLPPPSSASAGSFLSTGDVAAISSETSDGLVDSLPSNGDSIGVPLNSTALPESSTEASIANSPSTQTRRPSRRKSTNLDPPANGSLAIQDCREGARRSPTKSPTQSPESTGLWEHAKRFISRVLQAAIGSKGTSSNRQSRSAMPVNLTESRSPTDPTSEDFYSVIYIFTSPWAVAGTPPSQMVDGQSRGLWHLARCLLALQRSYVDTSLKAQSLAAPHLAWADCTAAEFLLNLTAEEGFPRILRLLAAYQNLTSVFGRWPTGLMGGAVARGALPIPEFLKPLKMEKIVEKIPIASPEPPVIPLPPPPPPIVVAPPSGVDSLTVKKEEEEVEEKEGIIEAPAKSGEHEVVLPAAMGGSWKEAVYMRLNNKVIQLQSDVSVSMRYLEELSQSYKRQTERLSASFNLTTAWLKATAKGAEERDLLQQDRIVILEAQFTKLLHILAHQGIVEFTSATSSSLPQFQKPFNKPAAGSPSSSFIWSVFFKSPVNEPSSSETCELPLEHNVSTKLSVPKTSLLFLPKAEAKPRRPRFTALTCFMAVFLQHLRGCLLSETFRLWLLHIGLAVAAQLLVYVAFLRSVMRRSLPTVIQSPPCKICSSTSSSFSLGSEAVEDVKPSLLYATMVEAEAVTVPIPPMKEEMSLWQETLKPPSPLPPMTMTSGDAAYTGLPIQEWQFPSKVEAEANSTGTLPSH